MVKRLLTILMLLILVMALSLAGGAIAHGPCDSDARGYGQDHIADHTPAGPPGETHNPGTEHQGYSFCNPSDREDNT